MISNHKLTPVLWLYKLISCLAHAREKTKWSWFKSNRPCVFGWYLIKSCLIDYTYLLIGVYRMPIRLCSIMSRFKKKQMTLPHRRIAALPPKLYVTSTLKTQKNLALVHFWADWDVWKYPPFCFWGQLFSKAKQLQDQSSFQHR